MVYTFSSIKLRLTFTLALISFCEFLTMEREKGKNSVGFWVYAFKPRGFFNNFIITLLSLILLYPIFTYNTLWFSIESRFNAWSCSYYRIFLFLNVSWLLYDYVFKEFRVVDLFIVLNSCTRIPLRYMYICPLVVFKVYFIIILIFIHIYGVQCDNLTHGFSV